MKLTSCFWKANMRQNTLSFIGFSIWNKSPEILKKSNSINTFKITQHKLNNQKVNYDIITETSITITLLIIYCYHYNQLSSILLISLYYSCLQVVLLSLKLLLTPFCFSYYFKFSRDHNGSKAFACFVLSPPYSRPFNEYFMHRR